MRSPYRLFGIIAILGIVVSLGLAVKFTDWPWFVVWPIAFTPITFALYWWDKMQSRGNGLRVPERVLILLSLFGGFVGGFVGMGLVRHKTKHIGFWLAQWVGLAVWGVAWWWFTQHGV